MVTFNWTKIFNPNKYWLFKVLYRKKIIFKIIPQKFMIKSSSQMETKFFQRAKVISNHRLHQITTLRKYHNFNKNLSIKVDIQRVSLSNINKISNPLIETFYRIINHLEWFLKVNYLLNLAYQMNLTGWIQTFSQIGM